MRAFDHGFVGFLLLLLAGCAPARDGGVKSGAAPALDASDWQSVHLITKDEKFAVVRRNRALEVHARSRARGWKPCATWSLPEDWDSSREDRKSRIARAEDLAALYARYLESGDLDELERRKPLTSVLARARVPVLRGRIDVQDVSCLSVIGRYAFLVLDAELEFLNSDGYCGWLDEHRPWLLVFRADDAEWLVYDEVWLDGK